MSRDSLAVMGTVASFVVARADDVRLGPRAIRDAMDAAAQALLRADERFSHYRADSDISRWLAGHAISPDAVADVQSVLAACHRLHGDSGGVFSIRDPRSGGVDTAGYVKGLAISRAVDAMRDAGVRHGLVSVGGDSYSWGSAQPGRPWRVAVADPADGRRVVAIVDATDRAVATSGTAERGDHIWRPAGTPRSDVRSFTVVGPDIATADAYATVGFALGVDGIAWVARHPGFTSLAVLRDGSLRGDAALVSAA
jgi:thiamine biosynthesis lipoprotein